MHCLIIFFKRHISIFRKNIRNIIEDAENEIVNFRTYNKFLDKLQEMIGIKKLEDDLLKSVDKNKTCIQYLKLKKKELETQKVYEMSQKQEIIASLKVFSYELF